MPSWRAAACALAASREAIASIERLSACCIGPMTRSRPIFAVDSTPQETLFASLLLMPPPPKGGDAARAPLACHSKQSAAPERRAGSLTGEAGGLFLVACCRLPAGL